MRKNKNTDKEKNKRAGKEYKKSNEKYNKKSDKKDRKKEKNEKDILKKRIAAMALAFLFMLTAAAGRCAYISASDIYKAGSSYNSVKIEISAKYTNIYDRTGERLNNNSKSLKAVIKPNEKAISELELLFSRDTVKEIITELSKGYPVVREVQRYAKTKYIKLIEVTRENSADMLCRHMIDRSTSGLEKYVSEKTGSLSVNYSVNALGRVLDGDDGKIIDENYENDKGVKISIDSHIQKLSEEAAKSLNKGSVVVCSVETGELLASVSAGGDYLNRSISPYATGSIFKLVVAAAALENGLDPEYECKSSVKVGDAVFSCQNNHKHGREHIKEALANSCNCYFVKLALKLGSEKIYNQAKSLGFGEEISLFGDYKMSKTAFPTLSELKSKGQLALLGFGQGRLTDTPVHFAAVTAAIANGGIYNSPSLKVGGLKKGKRALSEKSANTLSKYMRYVVSNGTGAAADYNSRSAGKTSTAQSGIYNDGKEQLNTWFVGFYPCDNPKYAVAVMCEGGKSGAEDCCPVFQNIVENLGNK